MIIAANAAFTGNRSKMTHQDLYTLGLIVRILRDACFVIVFLAPRLNSILKALANRSFPSGGTGVRRAPARRHYTAIKMSEEDIFVANWIEIADGEVKDAFSTSYCKRKLTEIHISDEP